MISVRSFKNVWFTCATLVAFSGGAMLITGCKTAALVGAIAGASAGTVAIVVIAKYKADERQKAAAEQQARIATVALAAHSVSKRHRSRARAESKKRNAETADQSNEAGATKPGTTDTASVGQPQPAQPGAPSNTARPIPSAEEMEEALAHRLPAYLAVPVPRQQIAAEERGQATYMLWDTHRQQLVTDDVYVLKHDVRDGATVKLNGLKAQVANAQ
jgi:hypothetical protein